MTWIDTYETHVIELAVERLHADGVFIPEAGRREDAPRTLSRDVADRQSRSPSGLNHLASVEPAGSIRGELRRDGTVR